MWTIDDGSGSDRAELRDALKHDGVVYVRRVEDDAQLLELARSLGELTEPGVAMPSGAHDGMIYSVRVRNDGKGLLDAHGNAIVSTTAHEFSLHTDGFNRPIPPRYVLLARADRGPDLTPSFVSDALATVAELTAPAAGVLRSAAFPSSTGPVTVTEMREDGSEAIRFNEEEILRWAGRDGNPELSTETTAALAKFSRGLKLRQETCVIQPTDCLVLDNHRMCHGRSEMALDSTRELRRVWVA
ncbi:MAG TPA: TauD/TfdA family dioxygenase [Solirubrobacteraceae bacterium]|jgi:alpha-ketoglutarate-dependent taurine dioxygenase